MQTEILYEDNDILVVYKPAGLATQTARVGQPDVVSELKNYLNQKAGQSQDISRFQDTGRSQNVKKSQNAAGQRNPGAPYLGVIHRLDQPVEGLLVFAKRKEISALLSAQLQGSAGGVGTFHKHYYAVLCGQPLKKEGELVDYLYKNQENKAVVTMSGESVMAKKAVLRYRVLQTLEKSGKLVLADIEILTGRFHQIRAQMAAAGTPLLGDQKYGNRETDAVARTLKIQNVALCAYRLDFVHPVTKKQFHFHEKPRGEAFSFFSQT